MLHRRESFRRLASKNPSVSNRLLPLSLSLGASRIAMVARARNTSHLCLYTLLFAFARAVIYSNLFPTRRATFEEYPRGRDFTCRACHRALDSATRMNCGAYLGICSSTRMIVKHHHTPRLTSRRARVISVISVHVLRIILLARRVNDSAVN